MKVQWISSVIKKKISSNDFRLAGKPLFSCGISSPSRFDPYFGDPAYLMTSQATSRLLRYFRTFLYMTVCGVVLVVGGGTFFIYKSGKLGDKEDLEATSNRTQLNMTSTHNHNNHMTSMYSTEMHVVGAGMMAIGGLLFVVGLPFTHQFWKRYRKSKDMERCPIVGSDSLKVSKKLNTSSLFSSDENSSSSAATTELGFQNVVFSDEIERASSEQNLTFDPPVSETDLLHRRGRNFGVMYTLFGIVDEDDVARPPEVTIQQASGEPPFSR